MNENWNDRQQANPGYLRVTAQNPDLQRWLHKMKTKHIIILVAMLLFCGTGAAVLWHSSAYVVLWHMGDYTVALPNNYIIAAGSANDVSIRPEGTFSLSDPHIEPKVTEVGWDERFVLAKQYPLRNVGDLRVGDGWTSQGFEVDYTVTNYWIFDTRSPKLHGPFTEDEYVHQKSLLSVSADIVMRRTK